MEIKLRKVAGKDKLDNIIDREMGNVEITNRLKDSGWLEIKRDGKGIFILNNVAYYFVIDNALYEIDMNINDVFDKLEKVLLKDYETEYDFECAVEKLINEFSEKSISKNFEDYVSEYIEKNTELDEIIEIEFSYAEGNGDHFLYVWGKKRGKYYKETWKIGWQDCVSGCVNYYTIPKLLQRKKITEEEFAEVKGDVALQEKINMLMQRNKSNEKILRAVEDGLKEQFEIADIGFSPKFNIENKSLIMCIRGVADFEEVYKAVEIVKGFRLEVDSITAKNDEIIISFYLN